MERVVNQCLRAASDTPMATRGRPPASVAGGRLTCCGRCPASHVRARASSAPVTLEAEGLPAPLSAYFVLLHLPEPCWDFVIDRAREVWKPCFLLVACPGRGDKREFSVWAARCWTGELVPSVDVQRLPSREDAWWSWFLPSWRERRVGGRQEASLLGVPSSWGNA